MRKPKPVYGQIAYTGGRWSVEHVLTKDSNGTTGSSSTTGYGEFPFADYPNIPVIDYTGNDAVVDKLSANICCKETSHDYGQGAGSIWISLTLEAYLQWHKDHGIDVITAGLSRQAG